MTYRYVKFPVGHFVAELILSVPVDSAHFVVEFYESVVAEGLVALFLGYLIAVGFEVLVGKVLGNHQVFGWSSRQGSSHIYKEMGVIDYMQGRQEQAGSSAGLSGQHMRRLVEQMRFKEKMEVINGKAGRYKRSTNNCHKKYIGILKNLLLLKLGGEVKTQLLTNYNAYRNSRVYYFIILSYLTWHLGIGDIRSVFRQFCREVEGKISRYKLESHMTSNSNFIHFRRDEITEMQYSLESINLFLRNNQEEAVRVLYQKNKYIIVKKSEYQRTKHILQQLQTHLHSQMPEVDLQAKLASANLNEVYPWNPMSHHNAQHSPPHQLSPPKMETYPFPDQYLKMEQSKPDVKQEEQWQPRPTVPANAKYPMLELANSYPLIDSGRWNAWITHRQKRHEFWVRTFEDEERKAAMSSPHPGPPPRPLPSSLAP